MVSKIRLLLHYLNKTLNFECLFTHMKASWKSIFLEEENKPYFQKLNAFLKAEMENGKTIFPPENVRYTAFDFCEFENTKVVLIGQDPYHDFSQAHGLSFSVQKGINIPPSLRNIFIELKDDLNCQYPSHGNLEQWAKQGVLLLNACLTVEAHKAGSHRNKGWEIFTDEMIKTLSANKTHLVFLLWGNYARSKKHLIGNKHLVLEAAHPSPLSAYKGFFKCKHFSKTNDYLLNNGLSAIDWQIH